MRDAFECLYIIRGFGRNFDGQKSKPRLRTGLPDGFFSDQKYQLGYILEDLGIENIVVYSGPLEYFTTIGYILWAFDNFVFIWHSFPGFGTLWQNLATLVENVC
jgi:hypothetical protein